MPGNTCNNCIAFKYNCTYVEGASVRIAVEVQHKGTWLTGSTVRRREFPTQGKDPLQHLCVDIHVIHTRSDM